MLRDLNQNYLHPLDVYPAKRLGPTGDAPKANCTTCHQGVNKPLYGVSMIDAWPELQTTGTPVYEQPDEAAEAGGTEERADAGTTAPN
jgi:photosynthetic reaction center cytochrome c subunit